MENIFTVIFMNFWGYDWRVFLAAVFTAVLYYFTVKSADELNDRLNLNIYVPDAEHSMKEAGEKLSGIEELGVTSWEAAEAEGLTEKDRFGRYGGGARRALHISIEGTEKLKRELHEKTEKLQENDGK